MTSAYFKPAALKGLNRIGDALIPHGDDFPSFSEFGGIEQIDSVIKYLPQDDIDLLNIVLSILAVMPNGFLNWLVRAMEDSLDKQGTLPSLFRQLNMGLRGILFACYYAEMGSASFTGSAPLDVMGYQLNRVMD